MATYCGHSNAPAEYALKEKKKEDRGIESATEMLPSLEKGARVLHIILAAHPVYG